MTGDAWHPWPPARLSVMVIAACVTALVFLGVSRPAVASSSPAGSTSAGSLVAEARSAMIAAGSVSATGQGITTVPGRGKVTLTEVDYTDGSSGSQVLLMRSGNSVSPSLPSAITLDVGGTVFIDADAPFWTSAVGLVPVQATSVADQWVEVPKASPIYAPAATDLTMSSLARDVFHARSYHRGAVRTVDGVRAVAVTYTNTGTDAGPVTCFLATRGSHLPVRITIGGLTLHLRSWGKIRAVSAPPGAIPLPGSTGSPAPGLPLVA